MQHYIIYKIEINNFILTLEEEKNAAHVLSACCGSNQVAMFE